MVLIHEMYLKCALKAKSSDQEPFEITVKGTVINMGFGLKFEWLRPGKTTKFIELLIEELLPLRQPQLDKNRSTFKLQLSNSCHCN